MGGAETETTVKRNRYALDSIAFRPRVLRDVSKVDPRSTFLGRPVRLPVRVSQSQRVNCPPTARRRPSGESAR